MGRQRFARARVRLLTRRSIVITLPLLVVVVLIAGSVVVTRAAGARPATHRVPTIAVYVTSKNGSLRLSRRPSLRFTAAKGRGAGNVTVDPAVRYQALSAGFGVAMTDTSAWLLHDWLPVRLRDRVMRGLFSLRDGGIGLSYLRVPIGGSDYIVGRPYTYDDLPAGRRDPLLRHFSLRHDRAYVLPMIRQALALNRSLTIMANPWSPPAWMKTDDSLIPTGPMSSTLRPDAFGPLARYLVKFLQGYRAAGVPVDQLGVQNEPLNTLITQSFPQMFLSPQDEGRLIRDYVGPALRHAHLSPQLLIWDYVYPSGAFGSSALAKGYIPTVMGIAAKYVDGIAFHCYLSNAQAGTQFYRRYRRLAQYETECSSYLSDIEPAQMAIRVLRNYAQGVLLWNAALDQNFGPKIGHGCEGIIGPHVGLQCIAPVIVDRRTHTYRLTSDYWALGQFSRFIHLGARRIASTTPNVCLDGVKLPAPPCGLEDVAFRNPDGTIVLVATTNDGKPHTLTVTEGRRSFSYRLDDGDIATFLWRQ